MTRRLCVFLPLVTSLALGCGGSSEPPAPKRATPSSAKTPETDPAKAEPIDLEAAAANAKVDDKGIPMAPAPPIPEPPTPEELKMLELDPKDLSPEDRRKRASIRYRQIMQNPDSPQARVIRQAQAQMLGQVPPQPEGGATSADDRKGLILHAPADRYPTPEERAAAEAAANAK